MKSKGIKNLLIDLGGVLINLDRQRCIEKLSEIRAPERRGPTGHP